MNSAYTVYNNKICLSKSTNAGKKKIKKKQKTWTRSPNGHYIFLTNIKGQIRKGTLEVEVLKLCRLDLIGLMNATLLIGTFPLNHYLFNNTTKIFNFIVCWNDQLRVINKTVNKLF